MHGVSKVSLRSEKEKMRLLRLSISGTYATSLVSSADPEDSGPLNGARSNSARTEAYSNSNSAADPDVSQSGTAAELQESGTAAELEARTIIPPQAKRGRIALSRPRLSRHEESSDSSSTTISLSSGLSDRVGSFSNSTNAWSSDRVGSSSNTDACVREVSSAIQSPPEGRQQRQSCQRQPRTCQRQPACLRRSCVNDNTNRNLRRTCVNETPNDAANGNDETTDRNDDCDEDIDDASSDSDAKSLSAEDEFVDGNECYLCLQPFRGTDCDRGVATVPHGNSGKQPQYDSENAGKQPQYDSENANKQSQYDSETASKQPQYENPESSSKQPGPTPEPLVTTTCCKLRRLHLRCFETYCERGLEIAEERAKRRALRALERRGALRAGERRRIDRLTRVNLKKVKLADIVKCPHCKKSVKLAFENRTSNYPDTLDQLSAESITNTEVVVENMTTNNRMTNTPSLSSDSEASTDKESSTESSTETSTEPSAEESSSGTEYVNSKKRGREVADLETRNFFHHLQQKIIKRRQEREDNKRRSFEKENHTADGQSGSEENDDSTDSELREELVAEQARAEEQLSEQASRRNRTPEEEPRLAELQLQDDEVVIDDSTVLSIQPVLKCVCCVVLLFAGVIGILSVLSAFC